MNKYLSFFRIRFSNTLQYRTAAYAGIMTQFFWGVMEIMLFRAFYRADASAFPMGFEQLTSYIWLQQAFLALFMVWYFDQEIFESITNGNVAYELIRPMDIYTMWFTKNAASRIAKTILRCIPILVVAVFLPKPYRLTLPPDMITFLLFLLTMIMGFIILIALGMLLYITTFYTLSSYGARFVAISIIDLLSGSLIPLPFFPEPILKIVQILPFASMHNIPLRVYSGNIYGEELVTSILLQIFWMVALVAAGKLLMRRAIQKVTLQGG